jgi:sulfite oxidase
MERPSHTILTHYTHYTHYTLYKMNGETLPPEHGYPLRVVVPGVVGVRNVKWVTSVTTSEEEAEGPWQRGIAYKGFAPSVKSFENIDIEKVLYPIY